MQGLKDSHCNIMNDLEQAVCREFLLMSGFDTLREQYSLR